MYWRLQCSRHWWVPHRLPGWGSQLMETWVLVLREEPGAQFCVMVQGSVKPCRLACPFLNDPW